jgi:hypothetical protein
MHRVTIYHHSSAFHLNQLHTGLQLLGNQNGWQVKSSFQRVKEFAKIFRSRSLFCTIDDIAVGFDMEDDGSLDSALLEKVDIYFKRGYQFNNTYNTKVRPYGLNYNVQPNNVSFFEAKRILGTLPTLSALKEMRQRRFPGTPFNIERRLHSLQPSTEGIKKDIGILFIVQAWETNAVRNRSDEVLRDRREVNDSRAELINALKKEFGEGFMGGFAASEFAIKHYPESIYQPTTTNDALPYFEKVKRAKLVIASRGLMQSNGYKLGEYAALGKCIISEQLFQHPGAGFYEGTNYISFTSSHELVHVTQRLLNEPKLRLPIEQSNAAYYWNHLHPLKLVQSCFEFAVGKQTS